MDKLLQAIQAFVAKVSMGSSTLRNQGAKGTVDAARRYLSKINLATFSVNSEEQFKRVLDKQTASLMRKLPRGARHWGTARKALNVFLRDCYYNRFLNAENGLRKASGFFEQPLDGIAAGHIRRKFGNNLPRWRGIVNLTPEISALYQAAAKKLAKSRSIDRVHLDVFLWIKGTFPVSK